MVHISRALTAAAVAAAVAVLIVALPVSEAEDNGLARLPPLGWNTWCTQGACGRDYCDQGELMSVADAVHTSGLYELGYRYVNMDDCWGYPRNPTTGEYRWDPTRFPDGMPKLADYIHGKGLKMGVYTDSGEYTCSQGGRSFRIPGSYGHYAQDAKTFASWGVDYVKMDWCNTKINGTQLDPTKVYPVMSQALNATKRPIFFNSCEWGVDDPWLWARKWMNSWRITHDHHDNWSNTASVIEAVAGKSPYAGPGGWNDMDFIFTGGQGCGTEIGPHCPGQTNTEYVTEFTMWAIAAAPILVATDIRNMTEIMNYVLLNPEMTAMHQDALAKPGDRVGFWDCSEGSQYCQIWARTVVDGIVVVLYNAGSESHDITADFSLLGPEWKGATVKLRNLWERKDVGTYTGSYTAKVESHGVVVVKATKSA